MKMSNFTNSSSLPEESDWVPTISHMPGQPVPVGTEKYQELCILVSPDHVTFTIMCWQEWYKCYLGGGQVIFTHGSVVDILQHHFTTTKKTRKVFFSRKPWVISIHWCCSHENWFWNPCFFHLNLSFNVFTFCSAWTNEINILFIAVMGKLTSGFFITLP